MAHRADDQPSLGLEYGLLVGGQHVRLLQLGQTEVQDLDLIGGGDEEIVRFQIAMDETAIVSRCKSIRELNRVTNSLCHRKR